MELKPKMTFEEMARHMEENTYRVANRVSVGRYARRIGYHVYKPVIDGRQYFFYVKDNTSHDHEKNDKH